MTGESHVFVEGHVASGLRAHLPTKKHAKPRDPFTLRLREWVELRELGLAEAAVIGSPVAAASAPGRAQPKWVELAAAWQSEPGAPPGPEGEALTLQQLAGRIRNQWLSLFGDPSVHISLQYAT